MRKFLAAVGIAGIVVVSASPAYAVSASLDPAGDYGTAPCYASVEYFRVDASVENTSPYVDVDTEGNVGAHLVCPIAGEIGRASCRGRVEWVVGAGAWSGLRGG